MSRDDWTEGTPWTRLRSVTTQPETPIYEESAAFDWWFKALIVAVMAATFIPGVAVISHAPIEGWVLLGTTVLEGLLFHWLVPRRFQLYSDRLRIVLGRPFSFEVRLDKIIEAGAIHPARSLFNAGLRMSTSPGNAIGIRRHGGIDLVISPQNRERFLDQLNGALRRK